ncbi:sulfurtransferase [Microbacterium abyssi]|uniref:sulfurtransferase n=1 Tax=Microbacterium abyssi TaxID=2782166 RepID=UPI002B2787B6|nr:rhodanese-like domain-containing protein [Microbacterium sp. A18JL241]
MVVAYDDAGGLPAARAWWLLRQGGVDVRVLDGGWRAWIDAGGEIETGEVTPVPGTVTLADVSGDSLSIDEAAAFPASGVLLDVRAPERFRGETEPLDPIAGHIPGAVNLPTTRHVADDGTLLDLETLQTNIADAGIGDGTPVAAYCGSGITAAHTALVLAEAGIHAKIFHGSWSQWSNTPGRPVART